MSRPTDPATFIKFIRAFAEAGDVPSHRAITEWMRFSLNLTDEERRKLEAGGASEGLSQGEQYYLANHSAAAPRSVNTSRLISPSHVKRYILDYAKAKRAHPFSRVSQEALDRVEAAARAAARQIVDTAPSKGKTL